MKFRNDMHKRIFEKATQNMDTANRKKMAVMYLITADHKLWKASKEHIKKGNIHLYKVRLGQSSITAYTFLCCAKDMMYDLEYVTLADLSNRDIISTYDLKIILQAIAIRRYGINGFKNNGEKQSKLETKVENKQVINDKQIIEK